MNEMLLKIVLSNLGMTPEKFEEAKSKIGGGVELAQKKLVEYDKRFNMIEAKLNRILILLGEKNSMELTDETSDAASPSAPATVN